MAVDYVSHLAASVLSDQRVVTYRTLARSLKCHSNAAKRMLYDFHRRENSKKASSVHATYLVAGRRRPFEPNQPIPSQNGASGDVSTDMPPSSPPFSSSMPMNTQESASNNIEMPCLTITLVREEELEDVKQNYSSISSIHIYSLEPAPIQDMHVLTDCNREIFNDFFFKEDPASRSEVYGVVHNKHVKKRVGQVPRPPASAVTAQSKAPKSSTIPPASKPPQGVSKPDLKRNDSRDSLSRPGSSTSKPDAKPTQPSILKRDSSDIFKSFSKAKDKPKMQSKVADTGSSAATPVDSAAEDTLMEDASSDEGSENDSPLLTSTNKRPSSTRPTRQEREAKNRKMLEDSEDDEPMPSAQATTARGKDNTKPASASASRPSSASTNPAADVDNDDEAAEWSASDHDNDPKNQPKEAPATAGPPRRRRGRRQVMRKQTRKDEDGYLVTQEEPAWESFSEDEPVPAPSVRAKPVMATSAAKIKKETKPTPGSKKGGGGNIMNFFQKR